jgi:hypothetical protein
MNEAFREIKEGVDADVAVDAQNAATATWKTADSFHTAPTLIILLGRNKNGAWKSDQQNKHAEPLGDGGRRQLGHKGSDRERCRRPRHDVLTHPRSLE